MLLFEYCFQDLKVMKNLGSDKFVFVPHANKRGSYRIFARYVHAKADRNFKKDLSSLFEMKIDGDWQWHHVVEHTHLKNLFPLAEAERIYPYQMPTVLVDQKTEHIDFNLLHAHGARQVFELPARNKRVYEEARREYLRSLVNMYTT